ncbi:TRAP transporter permease [uncultured Mailhella sp.]|uniref:TRAP transporter permease n=1 Tax=uncultured Mailhella sp. TaxID=1981031 RepID=UPI00262FFE30|nr:TRAP transporter permease [uncultured Mailhella sp.]
MGQEERDGVQTDFAATEEDEARAQALVEEKDSESRVRLYASGGMMARILSVILIAFSAFQLYASTFGTLDAMKLRSWHIIFLLVLAFLLYPACRREKRSRTLPTLWDLACTGAALYAFGYLILHYDDIAMGGGWFTTQDYVAAGIGVAVAFEAARRVVPNLAWLAFAFFAYTFVGKYIPGAFGHVGFPLTRVMDHMFWGSQGLLGVGVGVSATYVFLFVLFGAFLRLSGFSEFINDLALTLVGRTSGGPAKVSVIASALMGMINGSALANVATTGAITIPLMKKTGYKSEFAGAVEAVASTGGQFAPPIMGAVGFIMAEFLGVSYVKVMLAAAIPAFLYYLGLLMAVHFEAKKLGLKGLSREYIPDALQVIRRRGHLSVPLVALMALMFMGYTPLFAASVAIFATVAASWLSPDTRMGPRRILEALEEGARGAVGVGVSCVIIGIIIGSVSLTGLGLTFGFQVLKYVGEGQLYLGGLFVMLMSTVLGMGVPGVAAYVIVAAVAVPVLTGVGVAPMAAHMFCLFYACLSNITPPVAMSSYVAAGIARSNETRTSLIAMRLGLSGFILPFFFLNNPLLLYSSEHPALASLWAFVTAGVGVSALAVGLERWMFTRCSILESALFLGGAILTIDPGLTTDMLGFALIFCAVYLNYRAAAAARKAASPANPAASEARR